MNLTVNGKSAVIEGLETVDVTRLLTELNVETPEYVTVELNGEILDRNDFATTFVKNNDIIEFLYFMGGGAD